MRLLRKLLMFIEIVNYFEFNGMVLFCLWLDYIFVFRLFLENLFLKVWVCYIVCREGLLKFFF